MCVCVGSLFLLFPSPINYCAVGDSEARDMNAVNVGLSGSLQSARERGGERGQSCNVVGEKSNKVSGVF